MGYRKVLFVSNAPRMDIWALDNPSSWRGCALGRRSLQRVPEPFHGQGHQVYRIIVEIADFTAVFLFTGRAEIAIGFVLISNVYTSVLYFVHERLWDRVAWGRGMA
jgi:uncharacterized membrane protein